MDDVIRKAIQRVIDDMHQNLGEKLTVEDMARTAMFSKFHFSRIFMQVTGTSPGRFLTALRIQRAKHLLVSTSLKVIDISQEVGYSSVGTFVWRFSNSVGVSPSRFRRLGGVTQALPTGKRPPEGAARARLCGEVTSSSTDEPGLIFIGLFPSRTPQCLPVSCTLLTRPGPYVLENVPASTWYVLAHAVSAEREYTTHRLFSGEQMISVGSNGPIKIHPGTAVRRADLRLTPMSPFDPPVLLSLLDRLPGVA